MCDTYEIPAPIEAKTPPLLLDSVVADGGIFMKNSETMMPKKLSALNKKQKPTPHSAITIPASAGPAIRATLKDIEFNAMALARSRGESMRSFTID